MEIDRFESAGGRTLKKLDDGSILAVKGRPRTASNASSRKPPHLAAIRLVVLPHESLPGGGAGTASNGNFVLSEFEVDVDGKPAAIKHWLTDHQKDKYPILAAIDGQKNTGWCSKWGRGAPALTKPGSSSTIRFR